MAWSVHCDLRTIRGCRQCQGELLEDPVTGKAKAAIEGMGCSGQTYHVAWWTLEYDFGRLELIVNAQLRKIHPYPFIKPFDSLEILKYSQVVSGCVIVLTQIGYKMDIGSESVLEGAIGRLPNELKNKRLTYLQRYDTSYENLRIFSAWLKNNLQVQENIRWQFGSANHKARTNFTREKPKYASFGASSDFGSLLKTHCPLKDGEY